MAGRPEKHTVDYFPHYVKEGKTIFILESQFRNDGWAFWYKLLAILSGSENHIIDVRNTADWQFLLAKTLVNEETGIKILDLLSSLDAIDPNLWRHKIIWVQHLVDNFTDIYKKRGQLLPTRPIVSDNNSIKDINNSITGNNNTQSKVKESKVKESKVKESKVNNDGKLKFGELQNVYLTTEEYEKLKIKFGEDGTIHRINKLSVYISSKGDKYKSHYGTILNWALKDSEAQNNGGNGSKKGFIGSGRSNEKSSGGGWTPPKVTIIGGNEPEVP